MTPLGFPHNYIDGDPTLIHATVSTALRGHIHKITTMALFHLTDQYESIEGRTVPKPQFAEM